MSEPPSPADVALARPVRADEPWARLRALSPARIGIGRTGTAMPLGAALDLQEAHAAARDAVHLPLDEPALTTALAPLEVVRVASAAADRATYLRRPDLGRRLDPASAAALRGGPFDVVFVIADGLSAPAVQAHAAPLLHACLSRLDGLGVAPIVVARQARVALGDPVGEALGARISVVLVGERPGLTVADSLGAYITYQPRTGRRDSERNCISNIHGNGGLDHDAAANTLAWLVREGLRRGLTGVDLKEDAALPHSGAESLVGVATTLTSNGDSDER